MRIVALAFFLVPLPLAAAPAAATAPAIFQATLPAKDSGFASLAECERALGVAAKDRNRRDPAARGTRFNRASENVTRCEMIEGEPLMVVYPKGTPPRERPPLPLTPEQP